MAAPTISLGIVLALGAALTTAQPARAEILQGERFVTAMNDNTASGRTAAGIAYNLYFLPGGAAAYADATGHHVDGSWRLGGGGDVCVSWQGATPLPTGCYRVRADDRRLIWSNGSTRVGLELRGTVSDTFLTR